MTYALGIDLGTTYTAAAVARDGRLDVANLGIRSPIIPSIVFLREDDTVLVGDQAARRAASEPGRVAREFKRRVGDPVPLLLGGTPRSPEALMAALLRRVVEAVTEREGGPPGRVVVTHPANWGPYKLDLLRQAVALADLDVDGFLSEPVAAVTAYARQERVPVGATIAVYDLGGGTFDAAVVRKTDDGFELLGTPEGIEHLGGIDFDQAVFAHVVAALGGAVEALDGSDPLVLTGLARLRDECVAAKEALSGDSDAHIPVLLPGLQSEVRITRAEFEAMIRPTLADTLTALRRALRSAGVAPQDLHTVLLVGGSSGIPLVAELVSEALGRPVTLDAHPKHVVALGAAAWAAGSVGEAAPAGPTPTATSPGPDVPAPTRSAPAGTDRAAAHPAAAVPPAAPPGPVTEGAAGQAAVGAPPAREPVPASAPEPAVTGPTQGSKGKPALLAGIGIAVVAVIAAVVVLGRGGGDPAPDAAAAPATTTVTTAAPATTTPVTTAPATTAAAAARATVAAAAPTATWAATTVPTTTAAGPRVSISGITVDGAWYAVAYSTTFTPSIPTPSSWHLHFYFDSVPEAQAGVPGSGPWVIYDVPSPFREIRVADRPAGAAKLCAVVATHDHRILPGTGNCWTLPS